MNMYPLEKYLIKTDRALHLYTNCNCPTKHTLYTNPFSVRMHCVIQLPYERELDSETGLPNEHTRTRFLILYVLYDAQCHSSTLTMCSRINPPLRKYHCHIWTCHILVIASWCTRLLGHHTILWRCATCACSVYIIRYPQHVL